jgi:hypothetical protein
VRGLAKTDFAAGSQTHSESETLMSTLLRYDLASSPFPLQASPQSGGNLTTAQLIIVATNATAAAVPLQGILVQLPVGDDAEQLTPTQDAAAIGPVPPANWILKDTQYPQGFVQYLFYPGGGQQTVAPGQALVFTFNNVKVNRTPGTCEVVVTEGSNDCDPGSNCPTDTCCLTKFPTGWGTVDFWADPMIVPADGATTLNWSGPVGATYTIDYYTPATGPVHVPEPGQTLSNQGQYPAQGQPALQLEQNTTFYLSVVDRINNQTYSTRQNVPVTVESVQISASGPSDPVNVPADVIINWTTDSATEVSLQPTGQTADATSGHGQFTVQPTSDTTYVLTASEADGNKAQADVTVYVNPPQIKAFQAAPTIVRIGSTSTLYWVTISSAETSIDQGVGEVAASGHVAVAPSGVTTYTLMAQSQPPLATAEVTVIGAQPGYNHAAADPDYGSVNVALVFQESLWMYDTWNMKAWSSRDGLHWASVRLKKLPAMQRWDCGAVVFDAGSGPQMWIMGGSKTSGPEYLNDVWCTTDNTGRHWTQVAPVNGQIWSPRTNFGCVVFQNKIWVFGGIDVNGTFLNDVWSSPDGKTWTLETNNPGWTPRANFSAATFILSSPATNQIWLCGGIDNAGAAVNEVYYTNDGVHWSEWTHTSVPWQPRTNALFQQVGNQLWLSSGMTQTGTIFRDTWSIAGAQDSWAGFGQEAPWTGNTVDMIGSSVTFNGLMWVLGGNQPTGGSPDLWYFLPDD